MSRLNVLVAIEKGIKSKVAERLTAIYKTLQKPDLFTGHIKVYRPEDEAGEKRPNEVKHVQYSASKLLNEVAAAQTELFDATLLRDNANCHAFGDVVVDGQTLIAKAPLTYLLWLEKRLHDLHTEVKTLPTLDTSDRWQYDENQGQYVTNAVETVTTKKVQMPLVLFPATKEHPAQVKEITEDKRVGVWSTTKQSGALPVDRKELLIARVEKLQRAVKIAREEANLLEVPKAEGVGKKVFDFLLAP